MWGEKSAKLCFLARKGKSKENLLHVAKKYFTTFKSCVDCKLKHYKDFIKTILGK